MSNEMQINPERVYAMGAAARLLGMSASSLRDCERRGEIASTQTRGGHRRFRGAELLRLREVSGHHVATRKPRPMTSNDNTTTSEETKARHTWLGKWIGRAQRELEPATPADVRLRLAVDLERALSPWGPASPVEDVQPVVTSLIARAKLQAQRAEEEAHRHEMKDELIDFALEHLIDSLPRGVVGVAGSLGRQQMQALLRAPLRAWLSQHLTGSEDWDRARELTDEWLAQWKAKQGHHSRIPSTVKVLTVGTTGLLAGAAAVAALSPDLRARAAGLTGRLRSLGATVLKRFGTPPPQSPAAQPTSPTDQTGAAPPPSHPHPPVGVINLLNHRSQARYARYLRKTREARGTGVTTPDGQLPPSTGDGAAPELGGSPPASS
jgi:DNA-binding transcriptional MerR regulator